MNELVSDPVFRGFLSVMTGGFAMTWLVVDSVRVVTHRHEDSRDPLVADRKFGYWIGIAVAAAGVIATLRFNGLM